MSHAYDPNCPHCKPALIDTRTGQRLPDDHPNVIVVNRIFEASSIEEKQAFIRVTVDNGRDPNDLRLMEGLIDRIKTALDP